MSISQRRKKTVGKRASTRNAAPTTADLVVLSLLSERPMHGYELVKEYERQQVADWASVSRPHVYYALQKLAGGGLINAVTISSGPDPRGKAVYRLTADGRRVLSVALASEDWARQRMPTPFITWLGLSIHARQADRRRVLAARREYLESQIAKEQQTAEDIKTDSGDRVCVAAAMVGLCIEQFQLELRWLDELEEALLAGDTTGRDSEP